MKSREIWEMTPEEIQGKLDDAYAEMSNLRFQFSTVSCRTVPDWGRCAGKLPD